MDTEKASPRWNLSLPVVEDGNGERTEPQLNSEIGTVRADPTLIAQGWVRRHFVDPDRALESVELYTSMGYDVKVCSPAPEDFRHECAECASMICRSYVLIYTRPKN